MIKSRCPALLIQVFFVIILIGFSNIALAIDGVSLGPRPMFLIDDMEAGELKEKLQQCQAGPFSTSDFSIGHRGASLQFPEHTKESYLAAARMGAGIIECDATFTKDKELVCRHSQCDLHLTTDILTRPDLAAKCSIPFTPANYAVPGTLMTHKESIDLIDSLGLKFTPELKSADVPMPYEGDYSQQDYAKALIADYKAAGIAPERVFPQSFNLDDVLYWIRNEPEFGTQAVYLDDRYRGNGINPDDPASFSPTMQELSDQGLKYIAPPIWMLLALDETGKIVPSAYAEEAKKADLSIITWTLERSGSLANGGGWYYRSVKDAIDNEGDMMTVLDVLARDVGVKGVFSDWPATTTYYANCMGLD